MADRGVERLARRVVQLRGERDMSQAELASRAGLEVADIEAVEGSEVSASLRTLRALAKGFALAVSDLLGGLDDPEDGPSIGARVRTCRRARGLTLDELATASGLDRDHLERLETDQHRPDLEELRALANALGKSIGDLLGKGMEARSGRCTIRCWLRAGPSCGPDGWVDTSQGSRFGFAYVTEA